MQPLLPPGPRRRWLRPRNVIVTIVVIVVAVFVMWPMWRMSQESSRRAFCQSNVKQLGLGMMQYSEDFGDTYPWRVGASDPADAWRDLGTLFPDYVSESKSFFCPSSHDRRSRIERAFFREMQDLRQQGDKELRAFSGNDSRAVISYSYSHNAGSASTREDAPIVQPWTRKSPSTLRLLADKKAGISMTPQSSHWYGDGYGGRFTLCGDGHVRWRLELVSTALDPDEENSDIGARGAPDYRVWWSDPPYYGE